MMSFVNGTGAVKYTTVVNLLILWAVRIPAAYILHALGYGTSSMACVSLSYAGPGGHARLFFDPGMGQTAPQSKGIGGRGDGGNRTDTVKYKINKSLRRTPKMTERIIGNQIRLIPYYRNDAVSLPWYRDRDVWAQENRYGMV